MTTHVEQPIIRIENLAFKYQDDNKALQDINMKVYQGEKVAIIGPNGAGKSTLLLHLNGILMGSSGKIEIQGLEMNKKNINKIRSLVGLVFQSPDDQLFSPTVYEDVAFGPIYQGFSPEEVSERVHSALLAVQMENYVDRVSFHLSTGEKKKIAIATVLAMNPLILVLDEPTAGLDPRARRNFIDLLKKLPQTMISATHDLAIVEAMFPRSIVIDNGRIQYDGPTDTLLENKDFLIKHGLA